VTTSTLRPNIESPHRYAGARRLAGLGDDGHDAPSAGVMLSSRLIARYRLHAALGAWLDVEGANIYQVLEKRRIPTHAIVVFPAWPPQDGSSGCCLGSVQSRIGRAQGCIGRFTPALTVSRPPRATVALWRTSAMQDAMFAAWGVFGTLLQFSLLTLNCGLRR